MPKSLPQSKSRPGRARGGGGQREAVLREQVAVAHLEGAARLRGLRPRLAPGQGQDDGEDAPQRGRSSARASSS
jgi:hypothetical protein